jgi:hypothetical protein
MRWGSTDEEVDRSMVGDDIVQDPNFNATRAVTIDAPPDIKKLGFTVTTGLTMTAFPVRIRSFPNFRSKRREIKYP